MKQERARITHIQHNCNFRIFCYSDAKPQIVKYIENVHKPKCIIKPNINIRILSTARVRNEVLCNQSALLYSIVVSLVGFQFIAFSHIRLHYFKITENVISIKLLTDRKLRKYIHFIRKNNGTLSNLSNCLSVDIDIYASNDYDIAKTTSLS